MFSTNHEHGQPPVGPCGLRYLDIRENPSYTLLNPMARARVLVVEDDESVQDRYRWLLERQHSAEFICILAPTGQRALLVLEKHPCPPIDIVVLDRNLPGVDGLEVLRRVKAHPATRSILVLMVTGLTSPEEATKGLDTGADDYLRKDFSDDEFIARLHALLRRREQSIEDRGGYTLDGLCLDVRSKQAILNGSPLKLRPMEFALLKVLIERPDTIHTQVYLGDALSDDAAPLSPEAVRQQFRNLRHALGPLGERIETYRGEGYRLHTKFPVSQG